MKKKYWVHYYKDFSNTYELYWTNSPEMEEMLPDNSQQITRKKALEMARENAWREKYDSGFAMGSSHIYPADAPTDDHLENYGYSLEYGRIYVKEG